MSLLSSNVSRVRDLAYEVIINFFMMSPVETKVLLESSVTPAQSKRLQEVFAMVQDGQADEALERAKQDF